MQYYALLVFFLALVLFWLSRRQRRKAGLPAGRVVYSDTSRWKPLEKALFHPVYRLSGRPDYLVRQGGAVIPVEVKTGRSPAGPRDSHLFQLAAYCLLVENEYGIRPPYGILHYGERSYKVEYTEKLEQDLLRVIGEIRRAEEAAEPARSHQVQARCRGCGFGYTCEQRL
jgi:CRISPR-associated exonuclease Cas4